MTKKNIPNRPLVLFFIYILVGFGQPDKETCLDCVLRWLADVIEGEYRWLYCERVREREKGGCLVVVPIKQQFFPIF